MPLPKDNRTWLVLSEDLGFVNSNTGSHPSFFDWKADNTLFASFLGITDVGDAFANANASWVLTYNVAE
jgi:hypothetical protein